MDAGAGTVWRDGICIAQHDNVEVDEAIKHMGWIYANAKGRVGTMSDTLFCFPTLDRVLRHCANRDSKHQGDRINSILDLGLAGITNFVALKDGRFLEQSTITFFKDLGPEGLAQALFCINLLKTRDRKPAISSQSYPFTHTWLLNISKRTLTYAFKMMSPTSGIHYKVLSNGSLELTGQMVCVQVLLVITSRVRSASGSEDIAQEAETQIVDDGSVATEGLELEISFDIYRNGFIAYAQAGLLLQEGGVIKEQSKVSAHCIYSRRAFKCNAITNMEECVCLLVRGNLSSPGFFYMDNPFMDVLLLDSSPVTTLEKLTIW